VKCFRFIAVERASFPISLLCRVLGVSRSGFHAWERRAPSDRLLTDAWLLERIKEVHTRSRGTYGARRVHAELRRQGVRLGRKRVERLMRLTGISGYVRRRKGATTIRVPGVRVADDLVARDFDPEAPNRLWASDIKYVPTWQGHFYLASVIDCFSRRIVGWAMADTLEAKLVVDALEMALSRRRPGAGLVHHSDQGSQYVSLVFGQRLREAGIAQSMGSKGDCYDNAVCESFHATIEKDLLRQRSFPTRQEARTALFDYIETFYNRERLHSTLGYRSPEQYEHDHQLKEEEKTLIIEEERQAA
jgi:putative transposase